MSNLHPYILKYKLSPQSNRAYSILTTGLTHLQLSKACTEHTTNKDVDKEDGFVDKEDVTRKRFKSHY